MGRCCAPERCCQPDALKLPKPDLAAHADLAASSGPRGPGGSARPEPPEPPDSCALLAGSLDFLASPEWQSMPARGLSPREEALLRELAEGADAYAAALRALWNNWPKALEAALARVDAGAEALSEEQARDARLMRQKLAFSLARLDFVDLCQAYCAGGDPGAFQRGVEGLERRLGELLAQQAQDEESALPGLVGRRDTLMLLARVQDLAGRLLAELVG